MALDHTARVLYDWRPLIGRRPATPTTKPTARLVDQVRKRERKQVDVVQVRSRVANPLGGQDLPLGATPEDHPQQFVVADRQRDTGAPTRAPRRRPAGLEDQRLRTAWTTWPLSARPSIAPGRPHARHAARGPRAHPARESIRHRPHAPRRPLRLHARPTMLRRSARVVPTRRTLRPVRRCAAFPPGAPSTAG